MRDKAQDAAHTAIKRKESHGFTQCDVMEKKRMEVNYG